MNPAGGPLSRIIGALHRVENGAVFVVFMATIILPILEAAGRPLGFSLSGGAEYVSHLVLWLTFLGGLTATRAAKHIRLSTAEMVRHPGLRTGLGVFSSGVAAGISMVLAYASWQVVAVSRADGVVLPMGLPVWLSECVMPVALGIMALRFVWRAPGGWVGRGIALAIVPIGFLLDHFPELVMESPLLFSSVVGVAAVFGAPVFVAMAGVGMILYFTDETPISAISAEIYRLISSPTIPAIPLLTACGYLLAEAQAAQRLVRFFKALFGWMPGGVSVLVTAVCAIFTTFTGGSGVTIIALGGLAMGMLASDHYPERFRLGHVTATSSLGLLFPPSLPVILYAVVVSTSPDISVGADRLYLAGLVPGTLMIVLVAAYGVWVGRKVEPPRPRFDWAELRAAAWAAKWELSVPLVVIVLFASGFASMVEAAAIAAAYALVVECFITRDIHPVRDLPAVMTKAGLLVGAVLVLLAAAMGLSAYCLVEAELPDLMLEWVQQHIESPWVFLLALNGILLLLGSILEIYSAIVILPPILAPMALHYGVDPVHLGIIFLANLELGFLTPPVGLNLFLASSRFEVPMVKVYRAIVPYLVILFASVMIITYVPALSVGVSKLFDDQEKAHVVDDLAQPAVLQVAPNPRPFAEQGGGADGAPLPRGSAVGGGDQRGLEDDGDRAPGPDAHQGGGLSGAKPGGQDPESRGAGRGDGDHAEADRAPPGDSRG